MAALEGEGQVPLFLHQHPRNGLGVFSLIGLDDVASLGILDDAVHFAEAAVHAVFLMDKDLLHLTRPPPRV
jgi:hypothetical protein